jgi:hypothetical protein
LEGYGCHKGLNNATKASPYYVVNFFHKVVVHFSTKGFPRGRKQGLYTKLGAQIHKLNWRLPRSSQRQEQVYQMKSRPKVSKETLGTNFSI